MFKLFEKKIKNKKTTLYKLNKEILKRRKKNLQDDLWPKRKNEKNGRHKRIFNCKYLYRKLLMTKLFDRILVK